MKAYKKYFQMSFELNTKHKATQGDANEQDFLPGLPKRVKYLILFLLLS